jgi:hypothetical protein
MLIVSTEQGLNTAGDNRLLLHQIIRSRHRGELPRWDLHGSAAGWAESLAVPMRLFS